MAFYVGEGYRTTRVVGFVGAYITTTIHTGGRIIDDTASVRPSLLLGIRMFAIYRVW
jgi:hypothetical protein